MEIPTDSLRKLPEGAIFSQRDGHLTLDLSMRGDTIVSTAKADSLPCLELAISERAESSVEERSTVEHEPKASFWRCLVAFVIGFIGGALGGWLASKIKI